MQSSGAAVHVPLAWQYNQHTNANCANQDVVLLQEDIKRHELVADTGMTAITTAQTVMTNLTDFLINSTSHADLHVMLWQEDIRRNEFVAEYTGELINHREADRRGKAYDRDSNTYLFDLNDEWVIDAKHRGNKMRFANHRFESNNYACHNDPLNAASRCLLRAIGRRQAAEQHAADGVHVFTIVIAHC